MNTLEALVESERFLDEVTERHTRAQQRLTETTVEMQKALLAYSAAHNAHQIGLRAQLIPQPAVTENGIG